MIEVAVAIFLYWAGLELLVRWIVKKFAKADQLISLSNITIQA